jgi:hypothetical protein
MDMKDHFAASDSEKIKYIMSRSTMGDRFLISHSAQLWHVPFYNSFSLPPLFLNVKYLPYFGTSRITTVAYVISSSVHSYSSSFTVSINESIGALKGIVAQQIYEDRGVTLNQNTITTHLRGSKEKIEDFVRLGALVSGKGRSAAKLKLDLVFEETTAGIDTWETLKVFLVFVLSFFQYPSFSALFQFEKVPIECVLDYVLPEEKRFLRIIDLPKCEEDEISLWLHTSSEVVFFSPSIRIFYSPFSLSLDPSFNRKACLRIVLFMKGIESKAIALFSL